MAARRFIMRQVLFSGMAVVLGLAITASVQAKGGHGSSGHGSTGNRADSVSRSNQNTSRVSYRPTTNRIETKSGRDVRHHDGKSGESGHVYKGREHRHWKYRSWSHRYHCRCYWDEGESCWYYWCDSDDCYYPMSCADSYPPTVEDEEDD
jgi:hypothetical protein